MKNESTLFFTRSLLILIGFLLFFSFFASAAVITPLTFNGTSGVTNGYPSVDGHYLVWSDDRESGLFATYLFDLITGTETRISPAVSFNSQRPRISGNLVAYQDDSAGVADIFVYNISTGDTISITNDPTVSHRFPAISGNRIVWQDYRDDPLSPKIYMNGTGPGSETALSLPGSDQKYPDIYGNLVVWQDNRSTNWDIYLYNLTSHEEIQVTDDASDQTNPAISGNRIVWKDGRNTFSEIYINGTSPGSEYSLTPDAAEDCKSPSIYGSKVVWHQGDTGIYMNDTSLASGSLIPVDTLPGSYPITPDLSYDPVYGDRVVWLETTDNNLYLYTSGSSATCPVANFTHGFNGGAAPVTVQFTDQSDPSGAAYWFWDFGDGSSSTQRNPSHHYTDNSSYDVSLITGNPYCRNMTTVTGSVVIGRPVADFTASPTSDIVPAVITFTDRSSGAPDTWLWDFGDGGSSTEQDPVHTYTVPGTYSVTMTATNTFGSSDRTRTGYINALKGANFIANTTINGLTIPNCGGPQTIAVDTGTLPASLTPNNSVLQITPPADRGFDSITVYSFDGIGFDQAGDIITGNVTGVHLVTREINPQGFSDTIGGSRITVSYAADLASYPCNALLRTVIWENAVAADNASFQKIALESNFAHYSGTAYTTRITKTNFPGVTGSRFRMSVDSGWVASFTDGRNQTYIERISDDRSVGEVLDTRFVSHDAGHNLDIFEAGSPRGLSTFGLSALSGSGNPLQLITLTVTSHVNPPPDNPPAESDSDMPAGRVSTTITTIPVPTPTPTATQETKAPADPGTSAKVYTNAQGVVTQATRLMSSDGRAVITISEGITAKDAAGKPLEKITIRALAPGELPPLPSGSVFIFDGIAYEIGPDGATFSPPMSLSFAPVQPQWGRDYSVKSYDKNSGRWEDLPTTFDESTGFVTAQVSHLCIHGLFTGSVTSPPTATANPVPPTPLPQQAKAQSPTSAVSVFMSMLGWVADLAVNNIIPFIAFIFLGVAGYLVMQGRFPGSGQ